jgi:hypothetical protein
MSDAGRAIRAFALAPLAAPLLWWAELLVTRQSGAKGPIDAVGGLLLILTSASPWIYGSAVVVGVPAYWAIQRWSRLRAWHVILIAAGLGGTVFPLTCAGPATREMVLTGASVGAASGGAFWLLWRGGPRDHGRS